MPAKATRIKYNKGYVNIEKKKKGKQKGKEQKKHDWKRVNKEFVHTYIQ